MGALQHPDLPPDVRTAGGPATAHPRVGDAQPRPEGPDSLPGFDAGAAGPPGAGSVRSRFARPRAGGDLVPDPGRAQRPGLGTEGPPADRGAAALARDARYDPCLGVPGPPLAAGLPGGPAQGGAGRPPGRRAPSQPPGTAPDADRGRRPAVEGDRQAAGCDEPAGGL